MVGRFSLVRLKSFFDYTHCYAIFVTTVICLQPDTLAVSELF